MGWGELPKPRTVRTVDLPRGGFLVLDHIAYVEISEPRDYQIGRGDTIPYFSVGVITTHGTAIHCASFLCENLGRTGAGFSAPIKRDTPMFLAAKADAEAFMAELRYCIEHP